MMTERCDRCANISGLCAMVGCGGFVEKAPLEAVVEIANAPQHGQPKICPTCKGTGYVEWDNGAGGDTDCRYCNGTGKLQA